MPEANISLNKITGPTPWKHKLIILSPENQLRKAEEGRFSFLFKPWVLFPFAILIGTGLAILKNDISHAKQGVPPPSSVQQFSNQNTASDSLSVQELDDLMHELHQINQILGSKKYGTPPIPSQKGNHA